MLRHRTKKQIIVAVIFFSFWGGVFGLIAWATHEAPRPPAPPPRPALPVEVAAVTIIPTSPGRGDVVGVIQNPNADAGTVRVQYTFTVRVGTSLLRRIPGETFLLPGRQKYIVAYNVELPPGDVRADLTVEPPAWTFVGREFSPPSLVLVNRTTDVIPGDPPLYEVKGLLANEGDVDYLRVEVTTVGLDARGVVVGVSQSFLGSVRALERREFTAQWPLPPGRDVAQVVVLPEVNVFRPDVVEKRQGRLELEDVPRPLTTPR